MKRDKINSFFLFLLFCDISLYETIVFNCDFFRVYVSNLRVFQFYDLEKNKGEGTGGNVKIGLFLLI